MNRIRRYALFVFAVSIFAGPLTAQCAESPPGRKKVNWAGMDDFVMIWSGNLSGKSRQARLHAAQRLAARDAIRHANISVPALIKALKTKDQEFRLAVIQSLGIIGAEALELPYPLPRESRVSTKISLALMPLLNDKEAPVRRATASALGRMASRAKWMVSALRRLENDPDASVRRAAKDAIQAIER